ncbi:MAG TPA: hypothetical protein VJY39_16340 [Acidisphaera sp.]|nr:hypothetical protein [Acidisphaera sp.]
MADMTNLPSTLRPETVLAGAQRGLACWSKACTEVAHGLMAASMAQAEVARSLYAAEAGDWTAMATHAKPHEAGEHLISNSRARYEAAVNAYRKINDDLAAHVFKAAETLMGALTDEPPVPGAADTKLEAADPKRLT